MNKIRVGVVGLGNLRFKQVESVYTSTTVFGSKGMTGANNKTLDKHSSADKSGFYTPVLVDFFLERYEDSYRIELIAFIESFIQQTPSPISASEGLKSMLISLAAKKSILEKRVVTLTEMVN